jgi:hypothetical protein
VIGSKVHLAVDAAGGSRLVCGHVFAVGVFWIGIARTDEFGLDGGAIRPTDGRHLCEKCLFDAPLCCRCGYAWATHVTQGRMVSDAREMRARCPEGYAPAAPAALEPRVGDRVQLKEAARCHCGSAFADLDIVAAKGPLSTTFSAICENGHRIGIESLNIEAVRNTPTGTGYTHFSPAPPPVTMPMVEGALDAVRALFLARAEVERLTETAKAANDALVEAHARLRERESELRTALGWRKP